MGHDRSSRTATRTLTACFLLVAACFAGPSTPVAAQTISGSLIDAESGRPVPLGLVMMYTEAGDSITATVSDEAGRFQIASPEPGSFILRAAALGYRETPAGVFDLGVGGSMTIEYGLRPAPIPLDALLVSINRPVFDHHLVRNGFVRRFQRGLGRFITPHDIEESAARSTEALLFGIPQIRVATVTAPLGGLAIPVPFIGETVQIASPVGGWCNPTVYVDGHRILYDPEGGFTLSQYAHIDDIDAIEIYRRAAEIPVEFGAGSMGPAPAGTGLLQSTGGCGVLVLWTKQGLAPGRRAEADAANWELPRTTLPEVGARGGPPLEGERVRVQLEAAAASEQGLEPVWEGTFVTVGGEALVLRDPETERPRSLPRDAIEVVQVERMKGSFDAVKRGAIAGAIFGVGMAAFLSTLCEIACGPEADEPVAWPSIGAGLFVGGLVWHRGPGRHWVQSPPPGAWGGPVGRDPRARGRPPSR